jgi:hypothetical protein
MDWTASSRFGGSGSNGRARCPAAGGSCRRSALSHASCHGISGVVERPRLGVIADRALWRRVQCRRTSNAGTGNSRGTRSVSKQDRIGCFTGWNCRTCMRCGHRHASGAPGNSTVDRFASDRYRSLGPAPFLGVVCLLLGTGLAAAWVPARRAAAISPSLALRQE